jgi:hypothetical protein
MAAGRVSGSFPATRHGRARLRLSPPSARRLRNDDPGSRLGPGPEPMRVTAVGFAHAIGKTLYLHYRRGGRT